MNKYFIIVLTISLSLGSFAQSSQSGSSKQVEKQVVKQLKEVFGTEYNVSIKDKPDQIQFYTDFFLRCEYVSLNEAPSTVENISSLDVMEKYNPTKIHHDNLNEFDAKKFNVLKYRFNYYNKKDQYYRIYNTDTVLKINKLD